MTHAEYAQFLAATGRTHRHSLERSEFFGIRTAGGRGVAGLTRSPIANGSAARRASSFVCLRRRSGNAPPAGASSRTNIPGATSRRNRCRIIPRDGRQVPSRWAQRSGTHYGLCDIGANVHEWCADWFSADYYGASPERNPQGPATGTRRASRGGSWRHYTKVSRCAARSSIPPEFQYADYGFRVACDLGKANFPG